MAMGTKNDEQAGLFVTYKDIPRSAGHPFYEALETILRKNGFDRFAEQECERFYSDEGRPSLAPGVYFRCLFIGYFEGLDSERGIAWRVSDSLSLRAFLGLGMTATPPDHSTLSRTRRRLDLDVHNRIFKLDPRQARRRRAARRQDHRRRRDAARGQRCAAYLGQAR